jgi:serine/threonine protein kinase
MMHQLIKEIGSGPHGILFQAVCPRTARIVALKRVPSELLVRAQARTRCLTLAERLEGIEHPNLLRSTVNENPSGDLAIEMEWVEGFTLMDLLKRREFLSLERDARLLWQLAEAFNAATAERIPYDDELHKIVVVSAEGAAPSKASRERLYRLSANEWPGFFVVVNPWNFSQILHAEEPPDAPSSFFRLLYCLLGGSPAKLQAGTDDYTPIPMLSETGNQRLRRFLSQRSRWPEESLACTNLVAELMAAEGISVVNPESAHAPRQRTAAANTLAAESRSETSEPPSSGAEPLGSTEKSEWPQHDSSSSASQADGNPPLAQDCDPPNRPVAASGIEAADPALPSTLSPSPPYPISGAGTRSSSNPKPKARRKRARQKVISSPTAELARNNPLRGVDAKRPPTSVPTGLSLLVLLAVLVLLVAIAAKIWL